MISSRNNTLEFSSAGSVILQATTGSPSSTAGRFGAIQFLKDSEVDEIDATNVSNTNALGTTFNAGTILYGDFTNMTLIDGLVALHKV